MRRPMIVVSVALVIGLMGQNALAQQRSTGGATARGGGSNQPSFQVGGGGGGGLGESGNFGVGTAGQVDTNARFMRENRQGAFVGADSGDTQFVGAASAANTRASSRSFRRGGGGQTNVNQGGGRGRQREEVRMVLQLGFTPPKPSTISPSRAPEAVASQLVRRMEQSTWIQNRSPLQVSIDQGTATLRGVVATEHDRVLAERLALLEGGIWKVENLLTVEPQNLGSLEAPAELKPVPDTANE